MMRLTQPHQKLLKLTMVDFSVNQLLNNKENHNKPNNKINLNKSANKNPNINKITNHNSTIITTNPIKEESCSTIITIAIMVEINSMEISIIMEETKTSTTIIKTSTKEGTTLIKTKISKKETDQFRYSFILAIFLS